MITAKQMLQGYADGSFGGRTGPSFQDLERRQKARNDTVLSKLIQPTSSKLKISIIEDETSCSPPRNKKFKKKKSSTTTKKVKHNKWKDSDTDVESDSNMPDIMELCSNVKRSNEFQVALENAKAAKNLILLDLGEVSETSKWFEISSASSRRRSYKVEIKEAVSCTCEFFSQKNTPCKHLLHVYLNVLNICETSHILQQMFLTKTELRKIFSGEKVSSSTCETQLTTRAKLQSTSTLARMDVPQQVKVPLYKSLPQKPSMPEPQRDKYWLMKKSGNISKCNGSKKPLGNFVLGRIECDFFSHDTKR